MCRLEPGFLLLPPPSNCFAGLFWKDVGSAGQKVDDAGCAGGCIGYEYMTIQAVSGNTSQLDTQQTTDQNQKMTESVFGVLR
jgi:hypothetical protein